ncbi:hypothetical protein D3C80_1002340 [compost metagenome]
MPEGLDFGDVFIREIRQRLSRQPRRDTDAQAAGCEFEESETRGGIEPVEQIAHRAAHLGTPQRIHQCDDFAEARVLRFGIVSTADIAPDQRNGFGQIADIVVGITEQHLVHALQHQIAQQGRLDTFQVQRAGNRRQSVTPVWIGRIAEIIGEKLQLAVARGGEDKAVEKGGEGFHLNPPRLHSRQDAAAWPQCPAIRTSGPAPPHGHG